MELPEILKPLSWLTGKWNSIKATGKFPSIKDFEYIETLEFTCIGQPMLNYSSSSTNATTKKPMHQEKGFLKINPGTNNIALVLAHNFGATTIEEGTVDPGNNEIKLESTSIARTAFAKSPTVKNIKRCIKLDNDGVLKMIVSMETENTEMAQHLEACYVKVSDNI